MEGTTLKTPEASSFQNHEANSYGSPFMCATQKDLTRIQRDAVLDDQIDSRECEAETRRRNVLSVHDGLSIYRPGLSFLSLCFLRLRI